MAFTPIAVLVSDASNCESLVFGMSHVFGKYAPFKSNDSIGKLTACDYHELYMNTLLQKEE